MVSGLPPRPIEHLLRSMEVPTSKGTEMAAPKVETPKATVAKTAAPKTTTAKKAAPAKPAATKAKTAAPKKAPAKKAAPKKVTVSPEERYRMVEVAAYFIAERNGFSSNPADCWVAAEVEISRLLAKK